MNVPRFSFKVEGGDGPARIITVEDTHGRWVDAGAIIELERLCSQLARRSDEAQAIIRKWQDKFWRLKEEVEGMLEARCEVKRREKALREMVDRADEGVLRD